MILFGMENTGGRFELAGEAGGAMTALEP